MRTVSYVIARTEIRKERVERDEGETCPLSETFPGDKDTVHS